MGVSASAQVRHGETKSGDKVTFIDFVADKVEILTPKTADCNRAATIEPLPQSDSEPQQDYPVSLDDDDLPF